MRDSHTASHILQVAALQNVAGGGLPASWLALRAALPAEVQMSVLLPRESAGFVWAKNLRAHGITTYFAENELQVARAIAKLRPGIVHMHFVKWQVAATLSARYLGARVIWHLHSGVAAEALAAQPIKRALVRAKYFFARGVVERFVCVSADIGEYLRRNGVASAKIVEIPNGVDLRVFHAPSSEERRQARLDLGLGENSCSIVFFGRDAHIKGADRLVEVLNHLKNTTGREYDILCVAASPESTSLLSSAARVHDLGVVSDIRNVLWAADALALPSRTEALPYAVLEARATGLPVVASDLPGMHQLAGDPGTALVHYSVSEFSTALQRAVQEHVALPEGIARLLSMNTWTERITALYGLESSGARRVRKVLHIVHHVGTYGGERFVGSLANAQRGTIDEITILTFAESQVDLPGVRMITVPRLYASSTPTLKNITLNAFATVSFLPRLIRAIRALKPDIIHTHLAHAKFWGRTAAAVARKAPIIHTEHGNDFDVSFFRKLATRFLHKHTAAITAFSNTHADRIAKYETIDRNRIHIIPNGIEIAGSVNGNAREELGIAPDATILLALARLDAVKAHDLTIQALALLPKELAAHLLLAGTGPLEEELRALARKLDVEERVHFLGYRTDRDVLFASADVVVNTSLSEAMPLTLIEALCAGVPIACAPWVGAPELLDGAVATVAEDRSPENFAKAICSLTNARSLTTAKDRAGEFQRKFNISTISERYTRVYEMLTPTIL